MTWPPLEPTHLSRPPALGSSGDTKSLGPLLVEIPAHVQNEVVIAAATETPRGERACAVSAHVAEGHGSGLIRHTHFRLCELLHTRSGDLRANHKGQMSNLGRNLLIAIITAVICGILLYAAIRY